MVKSLANVTEDWLMKTEARGVPTGLSQFFGWQANEFTNQLLALLKNGNSQYLEHERMIIIKHSLHKIRIWSTKVVLPNNWLLLSGQ